MKIPSKLINKYNIAVPRYTSYPPANFFSESFTLDHYLDAVSRSNDSEANNISFYIHIPFCTKLCFYCGCNTFHTHDKDLVNRYIVALKKEISLIKPLISKERKISQIHWGGGTPNTLPVDEIASIMDLLTDGFELTEKAEIAIECNPALLDADYISGLKNAGFTRISMGVQDFHNEVLNAVNREVPVIPISELCQLIKRAGLTINLDLIYGLPYQTLESFEENIAQILSIHPDRLVTFSYAHVPWIKKAQVALEKYGLPGPDDKIAIFEMSWKRMKEAGYVPIGLDHYALPEDPLSVALKTRKLHRNFQGYCTRETTGQVYAFGITGISQLDDVYAQNIRSVDEYINALEKGLLKISKGYQLSRTDQIIRFCIDSVMCNQYLSWTDVANKFGLSELAVKTLLNFDEKLLIPFKEDGLLNFTEKEIEIGDMGRFFLRNIAALFDVNLIQSGKKFSRSV